MKLLIKIITIYLIVSIIASILVSCGIGYNLIIARRFPYLIISASIYTIEGQSHGDDWFSYNKQGNSLRYWGDYLIGDKILTILVYNPLNNYYDDYLVRWDAISWRKNN